MLFSSHFSIFSFWLFEFTCSFVQCYIYTFSSLSIFFISLTSIMILSAVSSWVSMGATGSSCFGIVFIGVSFDIYTIGTFGALFCTLRIFFEVILLKHTVFTFCMTIFDTYSLIRGLRRLCRTSDCGYLFGHWLRSMVDALF